MCVIVINLNLIVRLQNESDEPAISELEKELSDLQNEEERLKSELEALKQEEADTIKAIKHEETEAERLVQEENKYWMEYTRHRWDFMQTEDESRRYLIVIRTTTHYFKLRLFQFG